MDRLAQLVANQRSGRKGSSARSKEPKWKIMPLTNKLRMGKPGWRVQKRVDEVGFEKKGPELEV